MAEVMKIPTPTELVSSLEELLGGDANIIDDEFRTFLDGNKENLRQ